MKRKKEKKPLLIAAALFLVSAIFFVGWMEFHHAKSQLETKNELIMSSEYYLDASSNLDQLPEDSLPLNIYIGKLVSKGKTVDFVEDGIKPTTFAQRVVNLIFKLDSIPDDTFPLRKKISEISKQWGIKGNSITAFFVDYRPKNPDFKKYNKFIYDLKRISDDFKYQTVQYHAVPVIDKNWIGNKKYSDYIKLKENASIFMISIDKEDLISEKSLRNLAKTGFSFKLKLPSNYNLLSFDRKLIKQNPYFGNVIETIDAGFVKKTNEITISAMPRILKKD